MARPGKGRGEEPEYLEEGELEAEEQLALSDGEEPLPWLESDDDEDEPGLDTGRLVIVAVGGLLAIALVLGVVWLLTRDTTDEELLADGSTIEAPDEPYRTRPDDPGGQEVAGTGETSFEVAEGETVEGRIAGSGDAPAPRPTRDDDDDASPTPSPTSGGVGVQVGAYSSRAAAEAGWSQISGRIEALQGRGHRIVQGTADSGTIYRLQAVAGSVAEAETLCRSIRSQGGDCQVKR